VDFDVTDQLQIRCSVFVRYWKNNGIVVGHYINYLYIYFEKFSDSVSREVLYNILIEFGIPMKLVRLIKICLNGTYSKVPI